MLNHVIANKLKVYFSTDTGTVFIASTIGSNVCEANCAGAACDL